MKTSGGSNKKRLGIPVLEGMFLINASPPITHRTMKNYANFLISRFAVPHFTRRVKEVHIVLDSMEQNMHTQKEYEQSHSEYSLPSDHVHHKFSDKVLIPKKKRHECLQCKR